MLQDADRADELDWVLAEAGLPTDIDTIPDDDDVEPFGVRPSNFGPSLHDLSDIDDIFRQLQLEPT